MFMAFNIMDLHKSQRCKDPRILHLYIVHVQKPSHNIVILRTSKTYLGHLANVNWLKCPLNRLLGCISSISFCVSLHLRQFLWFTPLNYCMRLEYLMAQALISGRLQCFGSETPTPLKDIPWSSLNKKAIIYIRMVLTNEILVNLKDYNITDEL